MARDVNAKFYVDGREAERYEPDPFDPSMYDGLNATRHITLTGKVEVDWDKLTDLVYDHALENMLERLDA